MSQHDPAPTDAELRAAFPHLDDQFWQELAAWKAANPGYDVQDKPLIVVSPDVGELLGDLGHPPIFRVADDGQTINAFHPGRAESFGRVVKVDRAGFYALVMIAHVPYEEAPAESKFSEPWLELILCRADSVPETAQESALLTIKQRYADRIGAPQLARLLKLKTSQIHYARTSGKLEGAQDTRAQYKGRWYFTSEQVAAYLRRQ